ncbi:unnamed protein product [Prorocentrum cordatum]|uniref:Uncharacterized protein n=1 Tax=Prorocentrum cordatum TaxID=2364126 RepID=A0ABN9XY67_9DINO|nr:unnamed protein product [Polarella glacialis]
MPTAAPRGLHLPFALDNNPKELSAENNPKELSAEKNPKELSAVQHQLIEKQATLLQQQGWVLHDGILKRPHGSPTAAHHLETAPHLENTQPNETRKLLHDQLAQQLAPIRNSSIY